MNIHLPDPGTLGLICLASAATYFSVILLTRIYGLRSFSKMSSFDFAMTVAVGSVIAATVVSRKSLLVEGVIALAALYTIQHLVGMLRRRFNWFEEGIDNTPLLLLRDGKILEANLRKANVRKKDVYAKLREANVSKMAQVRAVVMETTGDISVLTTDSPEEELESWLLEGVRER